MISASDIDFSRAAASSMASGMPSSRVSSVAKAAGSCCSGANEGTCARARSTNMRTAADCSTSCGAASCLGSGKGRMG